MICFAKGFIDDSYRRYGAIRLETELRASANCLFLEKRETNKCHFGENPSEGFFIYKHAHRGRLFEVLVAGQIKQIAPLKTTRVRGGKGLAQIGRSHLPRGGTKQMKLAGRFSC